MEYTDTTTEKREPDVPFGKRDNEKMPLSWAEKGLTWLKNDRPQVFADMMMAILDIERTTGRKRGNGQ
jgi:hypothetical protein